MVMVNCTLPFMQLTEAGLPPSCAGGGARLTLMNVDDVDYDDNDDEDDVDYDDHDKPE